MLPAAKAATMTKNQKKNEKRKEQRKTGSSVSKSEEPAKPLSAVATDGIASVTAAMGSLRYGASFCEALGNYGSMHIVCQEVASIFFFTKYSALQEGYS